MGLTHTAAHKHQTPLQMADAPHLVFRVEKSPPSKTRKPKKKKKKKKTNALSFFAESN